MDSIPILIALLYVLQVIGFAARPSSYRWMYFIPIGVVGGYLLFHGVSAEVVVVNLLTASDYLLLTDIQRELRRVGQKQDISTAPLWDRLKWGFSLVCGLRCIGWSHESQASLASRPIHPTRLRFLVSRTAWLLSLCLLFDVGQILAGHNPSFEKTAPSLSEQDLLWRSYTLFTFGITSAPILIVPFSLVPSILSVAVGFSEPQEWPHLFGSPVNAYTLRNFWSRVWHQMLRRRFTSHGKHLAHKVFRFAHGTKASFLIQVCVAFFLSGLVHTRSRSDIGGLVFFNLQAAGIIFEDAVFFVIKRLGLETRLHSVWWLGYVWVWFWFLYALPWYYDSMLYNGMFDPGRDLSFLIARSRGDWLFNNSSVPFVKGAHPRFAITDGR